MGECRARLLSSVVATLSRQVPFSLPRHGAKLTVTASSRTSLIGSRMPREDRELGLFNVKMGREMVPSHLPEGLHLTTVSATRRILPVMTRVMKVGSYSGPLPGLVGIHIRTAGLVLADLEVT